MKVCSSNCVLCCKELRKKEVIAAAVLVTSPTHLLVGHWQQTLTRLLAYETQAHSDAVCFVVGAITVVTSVSQSVGMEHPL